MGSAGDRHTMLKVLIALCVLACAVVGQRQGVLVIDPFTPNTQTIVIEINSASLPQAQSVFTQSSGILGGERDLQLTAESGPSGRILTAGVSDGQYVISTPNSASGFSLMQYDGADSDINLNTSGLGGVDLTTGSGDALNTLIQTDISTSYTFTIYSGSASSSIQIDIPPSTSPESYELRFSDFTGNADFTNVGAIEILVEAFDNVDTFMTLFGTSGPVGTTPPPPPPQGGGFTWYTFDDDDNIIYYYFYGNTINYSDFYSSSDAGMIVPSLCSMLAIVFALFI